MSRDLQQFAKIGYAPGRGRLAQAFWFAALNLLVRPWFIPARFRVTVLRWFGAQIGSDVFIRHHVKVLWPWKLTIGDNSWIGEGAWLLNLEPIEIGSDVCISQEAFLCTGSHDYTRADFAYRNAPITVRDGAWIAARATVLAGSTIGECSVVAAGSTFSGDLPARTLANGAFRKPLPDPS